MRGLKQRRLRQLEHAGTTMARELKPDDDLVEVHAVLTNALITHELRQPFPDWPRIRRLALNLVEGCDRVA